MDDFLKQLRSLRRMGPMKQLLGMLPGVGQMMKDIQIDEKQLDRTEGIVNSMTTEERSSVKLINHSRRKRIAQGSGVKPEAVSQLTKQFDMVSKMSKHMAGSGIKGRIDAAKQLQQAGPGAMPGMPDLSSMPGLPGAKKSTRSASPKKKFKKRKR